MTVEAVFDALRTYKREITGEGLTAVDVATFNAVFASWKPAHENPHALGDGAAFYASVRGYFGVLNQPQVDGFGTLLQAMGVVRWPIAFAAYGLATAWHETNQTMQPVREAYWLSEAWRKTNLRYYPWYGRGLVQLTWKGDDRASPYGYTRADEELDLNGKLLADPDLALDPSIAAQVLVRGMEEGWFCTKGLKDFLPLSGLGGHSAFVGARKIINGSDRADDIAKYADAFQAALTAGAWA